MEEFLRCSQGHQWRRAADARSWSSAELTCCPLCGRTAETRARPPSPREPAPDVDREVAALHPELAPADDDKAPPPAKPSEPPCLPNIPGYEVLSTLGQGGMGVVYLARQLSLNRRVALKMIGAGAHANARQLARFHLEAEMLASLQHPHIVQVHEVGEHDGCPYMALEFVAGGALDQHLAGQPQPARPAAQLVQTLARAMHCAHQRGIIHRDLKPANVLVTRDGTPKITDFGLAKRLEEDSNTCTGTILGTPSYMAPEQAAGKVKEVGPLADVYALGALLYEMLTGKPPFLAESPMATVQQVTSQDPEPPSRCCPGVPRDLETICLKCLAKDPRQRYASAEALAEDLRRFLADESIQARPATRTERLRKWVRRRPAWAAVVLMTSLAALALVAGGLWHGVRLRAERDRTAVNYERAERNFDRARGAVDQMLTEVSEEVLAEEPHMEQKRRALLDKALTFYKELLEEKSSDPALRQGTAMAYKRVADIYRLLGSENKAEENYRQAIALLGPLAAACPQDSVFRQQLADCHNFRGEVLRQTHRPREAREAYDAALRIQEELGAKFPEEPAYRQEQARTHYNLGILCEEINRPPEARQQLDQAIGILQALAEKFRATPGYRQHLARSYLNLGMVLRRTGEFDKAKEANEQAILLLQKLREQYTRQRDYQYELAAAYNNLGNLLADGRRAPEALTAHRAALALFDNLVIKYPGVPQYRNALANTCNSLGRMAAQQRDWLQAQQHFAEARDHFKKLLDEFPAQVDYQERMARALGNLGELLCLQENWPGARSNFERAIAALESALRPNQENWSCREELRARYQSLAETLVHLGDHAAAAQAAAALPRVFGDRAQDYYYAACFVVRCMPLVKTDKHLDATARQQLTLRYGDQAVDLLREAVRHDCKDLHRLTDEQAKFQPLEQRRDFRQILATLDARTQPGTSKAAP
jgi:eukaryotic-like serine/threonine-protein kinase